MVLKWFGRYLDKIDITSKKKVFHSFRHTFETKCVEKKITAEIQNQICGWVNKGVGQRIYNKGLDIKDLYKEIKKIQYPELVKCLPHFLYDKNQTDYSIEVLKIQPSKPRTPRKSNKLKLTPRV
ncbi:MAG: hypothetical protein R3Y43_08465 [Alphaproteobacteria bacterium]